MAPWDTLNENVRCCIHKAVLDEGCTLECATTENIKIEHKRRYLCRKSF